MGDTIVPEVSVKIPPQIEVVGSTPEYPKLKPLLVTDLSVVNWTKASFEVVGTDRSTVGSPQRGPANKGDSTEGPSKIDNWSNLK